MTQEKLETLRYPIGRFAMPTSYAVEQMQSWISDIELLPANLRAAVEGLTEPQLDTPYRPEGWTIRQVVHHLADSHINAYCRLKLALTENNPIVRPYMEERWAELEDGRNAPISISLQLLTALHDRWTRTLKSLTADDFERNYRHPDFQEVLSVYQLIALYSWHCRLHTAHITEFRKRIL